MTFLKSFILVFIGVLSSVSFASTELQAEIRAESQAESQTEAPQIPPAPRTLMFRGIPDSTAAFLTESLIAQSINDDRIQVAKPHYRLTFVDRSDDFGGSITCRRYHVLGTPPEYTCLVVQK